MLIKKKGAWVLKRFCFDDGREDSDEENSNNGNSDEENCDEEN